MRVLFTTQPGFGHLNPLLPYARALRNAGHEVRIASSAAFVEAIEAAGFPATTIGISFTWEHFGSYFPDLAPSMRRDPGAFLANEFSWAQWNGPAARDLLASFDTWRPDVLVREFAENGATFAGLAADIPVVCCSWSALPTDHARWSMVVDWQLSLEGYAALGKQFGVDAGQPGQAWADQLTLTGLSPAWYAGGLHPRMVYGFRLSGNRADLGEWADRFTHLGNDRPLVYATLGTVYNGLRSLRTAMLDAAGQIDADVVLTVGRNVDPTTIGPIPDNVHVERFVPQDAVIARASLVLSHAGLGTMMGALYRGVPMVAVVIGADQAVNAANAAREGVAVTMSVVDANADNLLNATKSVLGDARYAGRATAWRDQLALLPPVDTVSDLFAATFSPAR